MAQQKSNDSKSFFKNRKSQKKQFSNKDYTINLNTSQKKYGWISSSVTGY